jgi:hypothetical protein
MDIKYEGDVVPKDLRSLLKIINQYIEALNLFKIIQKIYIEKDHEAITQYFMAVLTKTQPDYVTFFTSDFVAKKFLLHWSMQSIPETIIYLLYPELKKWLHAQANNHPSKKIKLLFDENIWLWLKHDANLHYKTHSNDLTIASLLWTHWPYGELDVDITEILKITLVKNFITYWQDNKPPLEIMLEWAECTYELQQEIPLLLNQCIDKLKLYVSRFPYRELPQQLQFEIEAIGVESIIEAWKNYKIPHKVLNFILLSFHNWGNAHLSDSTDIAINVQTAIVVHIDESLQSTALLPREQAMIMSALCGGVIEKYVVQNNKDKTTNKFLDAIYDDMIILLAKDFKDKSLIKALYQEIEKARKNVGKGYAHLKKGVTIETDPVKFCKKYFLNQVKRDEKERSPHFISWVRTVFEKLKMIHFRSFRDYLKHYLSGQLQQNNGKIKDLLCNIFANDCLKLSKYVKNDFLCEILRPIFYYETRTNVFSFEENDQINNMILAELNSYIRRGQAEFPLSLHSIALKAILSICGLKSSEQLKINQQFLNAISNNPLRFFLLTKSLSTAEKKLLRNARSMINWDSYVELADAKLQNTALCMENRTLREQARQPDRGHQSASNAKFDSPLIEGNCLPETTISQLRDIFDLMAESKDVNRLQLRKHFFSAFEILKRHNEQPFYTDQSVLNLLISLTKVTENTKGPEYVLSNIRLADYYAIKAQSRNFGKDFTALLKADTEFSQAVNLYKILLDFVQISQNNDCLKDRDLLLQRLRFLYYWFTATLFIEIDESMLILGIKRLTFDIINNSQDKDSQYRSTLKSIISHIFNLITSLGDVGLIQLKHKLMIRYLKIFREQVDRLNYEIQNLKSFNYRAKSQIEINYSIQNLEELKHIISGHLLSWDESFSPKLFSTGNFLPWINFRHQLEVTRNVMKESMTLESQLQFAAGMKELFLKIITTSYEFIYLKPQICFMVLGSISRGDPVSHSDVEFAVLLPEAPEANQRAKEEVKFVLSSLTRDILWIGEFRPRGFCLDNNPLFDKELCNTPSGMIDAIVKSRQNEIADTHPNDFLYYSLINPTFVFGNISLFEQYMENLDAKLSQHHYGSKLSYRQKWAVTKMQEHKKDYENSIDGRILPEKNINIKKRYIQPISFIALDFALYYGLKIKHPILIMRYLNENNLIDCRLLKHYEFLFFSLQSIRSKLHAKYERQEDLFSPEKEADFCINTQVFYLADELLLRPYYEALSINFDPDSPDVASVFTAFVNLSRAKYDAMKQDKSSQYYAIALLIGAKWSCSLIENDFIISRSEAVSPQDFLFKELLDYVYNNKSANSLEFKILDGSLIISARDELEKHFIQEHLSSVGIISINRNPKKSSNSTDIDFLTTRGFFNPVELANDDQGQPAFMATDQNESVKVEPDIDRKYNSTSECL